MLAFIYTYNNDFTSTNINNVWTFIVWHCVKQMSSWTWLYLFAQRCSSSFRDGFELRQHIGYLFGSQKLGVSGSVSYKIFNKTISIVIKGLCYVTWWEVRLLWSNTVIGDWWEVPKYLLKNHFRLTGSTDIFHLWNLGIGEERSRNEFETKVQKALSMANVIQTMQVFGYKEALHRS